MADSSPSEAMTTLLSYDVQDLSSISAFCDQIKRQVRTIMETTEITDKGVSTDTFEHIMRELERPFESHNAR